MSHSPFAAAFTPGARFAREVGGPLVMSTREVGALRVPSGRLVVCDPGTTDFAAPQLPLARTAPTGVFPVELALADFDGQDVRVACARVRFAAGPSVRWEPALFEGQAPGDDPAYGVDTGTGCFFDAAARAPLDETASRAWSEAQGRNYVHTWTWHLAELGPANVAMFSSGWGDGLYASYWGFDERDRLVELVSDFDLLCEPVREQLELPLPLPRGTLAHPWLAARGITVRRPLLSSTSAVVQGPAGTSAHLSDGMVVRERWTGDTCRYAWKHNTPGLRLVVSTPAGVRPLEPL